MIPYILKNRSSWILVYAVACCFFFLGAKAPAGIMSTEEMLEVLVDLELAKAASSYNRTEDDAKAFFFRNEAEIFMAHDISPEIFERSYNYYIARPEEFLAIYNGVVIRLESWL